MANCGEITPISVELFHPHSKNWLSGAATSARCDADSVIGHQFSSSNCSMGSPYSMEPETSVYKWLLQLDNSK